MRNRSEHARIAVHARRPQRFAHAARLRLLTAALISGAALIAAWPADAVEVFRWVDANGVVHYSDEKPRDDESFATLQIESSRAPDYDPQTDPYSILNQAARLAEARAARSEAQTAAQTTTQAAPAASTPQQREAGTRYLSTTPWWYYAAGPAPYARPADPRAAARQQTAIEQLNLAAPRPASINSGVHRDRVQRSTALPTTPVRDPR